MTRAPRRRTEARLLAGLEALAMPDARLRRRDDGGADIVRGHAGDRLRSLSPQDVDRLLADGLLDGGPDGLRLAETGRARLRRASRLDDPWRAQHLDMIDTVLEDGAGRRVVTTVANESPLAWLRRRRGADGAPLVSETRYLAGERLRADFERAGLMARVTADWSRPAGRQRRGATNPAADVIDSAIAARQRVNAVFRALGPELAALLIDVCCLLIGLEDAERRRGWPRRSAKVVLGIGLDRLAAHYGLSESATGPERVPTRHWGAADYRPQADPAAAERG
jgi:hypothetical protein